jgi:hypothetical protein
MLELAAKPSHYAHFCALSRYGVTTERPDLRPTFVGLIFGGIRDVRLALTVPGRKGRRDRAHAIRGCLTEPDLPIREKKNLGRRLRVYLNQPNASSLDTPTSVGPVTCGANDIE